MHRRNSYLKSVVEKIRDETVDVFFRRWSESVNELVGNHLQREREQRECSLEDVENFLNVFDWVTILRSRGKFVRIGVRVAVRGSSCSLLVDELSSCNCEFVTSRAKVIEDSLHQVRAGEDEVKEKA